MTGNVKVTRKKKMGICIWVGACSDCSSALSLSEGSGRDSVYIDGTFVQHSGDSAVAFFEDRRHRRRRQHYDTDGLSETQPDHAGT